MWPALGHSLVLFQRSFQTAPELQLGLGNDVGRSFPERLVLRLIPVIQAQDFGLLLGLPGDKAFITPLTYRRAQPVAVWLSYTTGTRKVGGSNPGVATIRSTESGWALEQDP